MLRWVKAGLREEVKAVQGQGRGEVRVGRFDRVEG